MPKPSALELLASLSVDELQEQIAERETALAELVAGQLKEIDALGRRRGRNAHWTCEGRVMLTSRQKYLRRHARRTASQRGDCQPRPKCTLVIPKCMRPLTIAPPKVDPPKGRLVPVVTRRPFLTPQIALALLGGRGR